METENIDDEWVKNIIIFKTDFILYLNGENEK